MGHSTNARRFGHSGGGNRPTSPTPATSPTGSPDDLPDDWFTAAPTIEVDREEIVVVGPPEDAGPAAVEGRVSRFRESTQVLKR